jgi:hypothetical protein
MLQTHRVITLSDNDWLPLPVGSFTVLKYSPLSQPIHMHSGVMVEDEWLKFTDKIMTHVPSKQRVKIPCTGTWT